MPQNGSYGKRCGHRWMAPLLHPPPSTKVSHVEQVCVLPKGHDGSHRSIAKVTAPNA